MNTKIVIALSIAALSLATTAFAEGEGSGQPGLAQSQAYFTQQPVVTFDNTVLPSLSHSGAVQTANSLPRGFENGTVEFTQAQLLNRYEAQRSANRYAQQQAASHHS